MGLKLTCITVSHWHVYSSVAIFFYHSLSILLNIFVHCLVLLAVLVCTLNCLDVEMHNINKRNLSLSENRDFCFDLIGSRCQEKKELLKPESACMCVCIVRDGIVFVDIVLTTAVFIWSVLTVSVSIAHTQFLDARAIVTLELQLLVAGR